ncbi:MAG: hypothetical protein HZA78_08540 [Candidatus Schekmanbacteria bacterium]|nr:hypothetical protein [Candidatus Schekmanbacteria bacterium]
MKKEILTRYVTQSNQIKSSNNTVKSSAFMPARNGKTSMFRINDLQSDEIWKIGNDVAEKLQKHLYGRADILETAILNSNLQYGSR